MKKFIIFVALFTTMAIATQTINAQTGIHITVYNQLTSGSISVGPTASPQCYGGAPGIITGTLPTGGQGNYSFQWEKSVDGGFVWTNIPLATNLDYTPGTLTTTTDFRRKVTDNCGTVATNIITITVYGQFVAGTTTGGTTPICNGGNGGILTSTASTGGAPGTTYQWQQSADGTTWSDIPTATALTYTIGNLSTTTYFRIAFINPSCGTIYGNVTSIVVYNPFVAGTVTGGNTGICNGADGGILTSTAPTGGAPGTTLQWEKSVDGITYTDVAGQTTLTLVVGNITQTMWYRLRYINTCGVVYSLPTNLVVFSIFAQGSISAVGGTTICNGVDFGLFAGIAATGGAAGTTSQWQQSTNNGVTWTDIAGATMITYDPSALTTTTQFRRKDINACGILFTNIITITVYPVFTPGTIGVNQNICYGTAPMQLSNLVAPVGGTGTYTYQWQESIDGGLTNPWTDVSGETNASFQPPSLTSGIWYRRLVNGGFGILPSLP